MVLTRNPKIILILSFLLLPVALYADQFRIIRVNDGDTITAVSNGKEIKIRLVGIDAPEFPRKKHLRGQPFSLKAKEHLATLVLNKPVTLKCYGKDSNAQTLCQVFENGFNVNLEMVNPNVAKAGGLQRQGD